MRTRDDVEDRRTDDDDGRENRNNDVNDHDYDTVRWTSCYEETTSSSSDHRGRMPTTNSPPYTGYLVPSHTRHGLHPNTDRTDMTTGRSGPTGAGYSDSPDASTPPSDHANVPCIRTILDE